MAGKTKPVELLPFDLVFLDLETTGFDAQQDRMIEIAAIAVNRDGTRDTLHYLIQPGCSIPNQITRLTGIDDVMVAGAPMFSEVEKEVLTFLEHRILVAHNAGFDRSFIEAACGFELPNLAIDTIELTKLLHPNLLSYSLRDLVRVFSLPTQIAHRAMADTLALENLFWVLLEEAKALPLETLQGIYCFFEGVDNGLSRLIEVLLQVAIRSYSFGPSRPKVSQKKAPPITAEPLIWDIPGMEAFFQPGGQVSQAMEAYQPRPEQISMMKAVAKAFKQERHLLAEAGTGVGKSLAYLVPAVTWALTQEEKVIVATHTIALQEQLLHSEIQFLNKTMVQPFKASVLKGRSHYLCLHKWKTAKDHAAHLAWSERLLMARLNVWLATTESGDKDGINLRGREVESFSQMATVIETCLGSGCAYYQECYYQRAKQKAQEAHVLIVNHSLLLADLKLGETLLPRYRYLIIDEAHHLEEEGIRQFSQAFSLRDFQRKLASIFKKQDNLGRPGIFAYLRKVATQKGDEQAVDQLIKMAEQALTGLNQTVGAITEFVFQSQYWETVRVHEEVRALPWWENMGVLYDNLVSQAIDVFQYLDQLARETICQDEEAAEDGIFKRFKALLGEAKVELEVAKAFFSEVESQRVYWLEKDSFKNDLCLYMTPLFMGSVFDQTLFSTKTVVLTSATLSVDGDFSYLMGQLGLERENVDQIRFSSPFLYDEQALLLVDNSLPSPGTSSEEQVNLAMRESLLKILKATGGGSLVLFTAHKQLRWMFESLRPDLLDLGLELFADGVNGRRHVLLQELKNNSRAIVFGANTFWEGIDLPGNSLTAVIIVKLPFLPPNLPLVEARSEALKSEGKDGFYHYSLPQAVLRFRQGYGRLIRSINDCGVVVVLDGRLVSKRYGKAFINSLPNQKFKVGSTMEIVEQIKKWFLVNKIKSGLEAFMTGEKVVE